MWLKGRSSIMDSTCVLVAHLKPNKQAQDITRWREHMKFIFEWKNISQASAANE